MPLPCTHVTCYSLPPAVQLVHVPPDDCVDLVRYSQSLIPTINVLYNRLV